MTKKHDDIFDAVLSGVPSDRRANEDKSKPGTRFLKRSTGISEKLSGENEEKTLRWVDPKRCRMWAQHNRDYSLLTEENCSDLIEGIRAQGQQEFPAIVRRVDEPDFDFEVICGARRHFAISWLRKNNYAQFKYLIEERDLTDEEAFRLADIENRDREDISDYERAVDYANAIELYYGGKQKSMAERLEVSAVWLSRYLELARLPDEVVSAFFSIRDVRELHARTLKPALKNAKLRSEVLKVAAELSKQQSEARAGRGSPISGAAVMARLKSATSEPKKKQRIARNYATADGETDLTFVKIGRKCRIEFADGLSKQGLERAFAALLKDQFD